MDYYHITTTREDVIEEFIKRVLKANRIKTIPNKFVKLVYQEDEIYMTYKNKRLLGTLIFDNSPFRFTHTYKIVWDYKESVK
jgi:hypothetical protein